jgi:phosphate uptake regulator
MMRSSVVVGPVDRRFWRLVDRFKSYIFDSLIVYRFTCFYYVWGHRESRMETRKVQVTGGSTYTVSLPKSWATENDVDAGSIVEFHSEDDLLLLAPHRDDERTEGTLDITGLTETDELTRAVMTMYVSGFDVIQLETGRITAGQRRIIREATQGLVGLEVIEETSERVVLQDLLDSSELSIHNAITRMRLVSLTMLTDAVEALIENDDALAQDVVERDDDVDRLWYMVSRVFRTVLRNPTAATEIGFPRETVFDFQSSARQLERIADHATKIAKLALEIGDLPAEATDPLEKLLAEAIEVPETAMDALLTDDHDEAVELATQARARIDEVDARSRSVDEYIREFDPQVAQTLGLVVDSLSRTADYGSNIAENALQKAAPNP